KAVTIPTLSYLEAIEMSYYGAKIIHPKTIKPLQNANIPLLVKSFVDPTLPGTIIGNLDASSELPMVIFEFDQSVITFRTKDFSFINESHLSHIISAFDHARLKINIM